MLSKYFTKKILKKKDLSSQDDRSKIGLISGVYGLIINLILFTIKLAVGYLVNSIAVVADAFNNLSDSLSSLITIVGFKLSNKPADKEHPYGHGRLEYITTLIISILVLLVGLEFSKSSWNRIRNPKSLNFQFIPFILLVFSLLFKLFLYRFNRKLSQSIESPALLATAADALGDIFTTSVIIISLFVANFTKLALDGYIGMLVSLLIIYSGLNLIKDTISSLLGENLDDDTREAIEDKILTYPYITGVHDLRIHNYGPGRTLATIHVEFPDTLTVMEIHRLINRAEREVGKKFNLELLIHMDPITSNKKEINMQSEIQNNLAHKKEILSIHDFILYEDENEISLDLIVDGSMIVRKEDENKIIRESSNIIKELYPQYNNIIQISKTFI